MSGTATTALLTFRRMVVDGIAARLPELKSVAAHPGRFDLEELKRFALAAPAVRVALPGLPRVEVRSDERLEVTAQVACFVVTRDAPGLPRDDAALAIAQGLLELAALNQWGVDAEAGFGVLPARELRAESLYSAEIDRAGVAFWAVSWRQRLILRQSVFAPSGPLPAELYVRFAKDDPQPRLIATGDQAGG